jgi:hypothetical protein
LQETGVARTRVECKNGDEWRGRETDLLGGLGNQVGPRKPLKRGRQLSAKAEPRAEL